MPFTCRGLGGGNDDVLVLVLIVIHHAQLGIGSPPLAYFIIIIVTRGVSSTITIHLLTDFSVHHL